LSFRDSGESTAKKVQRPFPRRHEERARAVVSQEVLAIKKVGLDDNSFDLGGHSLLMVRLRNKLQQALESDISIFDLFRFPTIRALARHLGQQSIQDALVATKPINSSQ
jgi:acyl carrier protein